MVKQDLVGARARRARSGGARTGRLDLLIQPTGWGQRQGRRAPCRRRSGVVRQSMDEARIALVWRALEGLRGEIE